MRRFSLDEIPQVLNVLRGEMSLVGPRPLPVRDYLLLEDWHRRRYRVLPGMTGLWQISGPLEPDVRRPRPPRLLLPRELVRLARHHDPREDGSRGGEPTRCLLRRPKIVAVASAADLDFRYGCTPAWWQLWKGMHDVGVDLIVTTYRGKAIESPWWRTAPNPLYREAETFARARDAVARLKGDHYLRRAEDSPDDTRADRAVREVVWRYVTPRWRKHLESLLERERDVDAVIFFTVPMSHFRGIPSALRERFDVPVVFYDGDVPMSLPEFGGMDTGFNYYHGADPRNTTSCSRTPRAGSSGCASSARGGRRRCSGPPTPSCSTRTTSTRSTTSSSTATATSSGASGWRRSSASRRDGCRRPTSRSAAATSAATSGSAR